VQMSAQRRRRLGPVDHGVKTRRGGCCSVVHSIYIYPCIAVAFITSQRRCSQDTSVCHCSIHRKKKHCSSSSLHCHHECERGRAFLGSIRGQPYPPTEGASASHHAACPTAVAALNPPWTSPLRLGRRCRGAAPAGGGVPCGEAGAVERRRERTRERVREEPALSLFTGETKFLGY
jgi:hypothetical protein